jgi:histone deacetylase 6
MQSPIIIDDDSDEGPRDVRMSESPSHTVQRAIHEKLNMVSPDRETSASRPAHPRTDNGSNSIGNITPAISVSTSATGSSDRLHDEAVRNLGRNGHGFNNTNSTDQYRTGYVYSAQMMLHANPIDPEHPEKPVRIWKIYKLLHERSLLRYMKRIPIREVTEDEVKLVHDQGIWTGVEMSACKFLAPDAASWQRTSC